MGSLITCTYLDCTCSRRLLGEWDALAAQRFGRRRERRAVVTLVDFEHSLDNVLADCDLDLRTAYRTAVETTGALRTRKSILEAMAVLPGPDVTFQQVRESFLKLHPEYRATKN